MSGRQPGGRYAVYQLQGRNHTGSRVAEVHHRAVTQPLHRPTAALERASSDKSAQPLSQVGGGLVATLVCEAGVTGNVEEADGRRSVEGLQQSRIGQGLLEAADD